VYVDNVEPQGGDPLHRSALMASADELEALLRLSLGDLRSPAELATRLPGAARGLPLAKIARVAGDHHAAQQHLQATSPGRREPRRALVHQLLLAATAIARGDPMSASSLVPRHARRPWNGPSTCAHSDGGAIRTFPEPCSRRLSGEA
jgi:hypothetical protein